MNEKQFLESVMDGEHKKASAFLEANNIFVGEKTLCSLTRMFDKHVLFNENPLFFIKSLSKSANHEQGLLNLERLLLAVNSDAISTLIEHIDILLILFSSSHYLTEIFFKEAGFFIECLKNKTLTSLSCLQKPKLKYLQADTPEVSISKIRRFRNREILRIGLLDLARLADPLEILRELSYLARYCIDETYKVWASYMEAKHGFPVEGDSSKRSRFTILGMGKLGGDELNFSSDVDLIYIYSSTDGQTTKSGITNHEYFLKLGHLITKSLQEVSMDGMMYRVDLGLRPGGKDGEIAISIDSAELYYESWGQTWERQAMIKVCPVGGDISLGNEFCKMITPFVYRKSIDFETIEKVKTMKTKIHEHISKKEGALFSNVKLGMGGIREIEFVAQTFQILFGGKKEYLRIKSTMPCIKRLEEDGLITYSDEKTLHDAYIFLRELENRIQMNNGNQEHSVPKEFIERVFLGRKMGFLGMSPSETVSQFIAEYKMHKSKVQAIYKSVFESSDKSENSCEEVRAIPSEKIFSDQQAIEGAFTRICNGVPPRTYTSEKSRFYFDKLKPEIIYICKQLPDPDLAIINFETYVSKYGAVEMLFEMLHDNTNILKLLLEIFSRSEFLTKRVCAHPELIETMLIGKHLYGKKSKSDTAKELDSMEYCSTEDATRKLFKYKESEELRIGLQKILNLSGTSETFTQLSCLAGAILAKALELSLAKNCSRFGVEPLMTKSCGLAVIAGGKFGGKELNFASDLDIFFVFADGALPESVYPQEFYIRVCQEISHLLANPTMQIYQLDMDLRPDGKQGVLVTELSQLDKYYKTRGQTWERQAMIKARFVTGDAELGNRVSEVMQNFSYGAEFPSENLEHIEYLREEMKKQRGQEFNTQMDLKFGFGGLTEIEFTIQVLQLKGGCKNEKLRKNSTLEAMDALLDSDILPETDFSRLKEAYLFLRNIELSIRIINDLPVNTFNVSEENLVALAKRLNMKNSNIMETYKHHTNNVHMIYEALIGGKAAYKPK